MKKLLTTTVIAGICSSAAYAEGVVNVYNWSDYIAEDTIEKFTAETGIKVVYDVYDSNEVLEAKMLAGNSGYDVVVPTSDFLQRQISAGVYQPLNKDMLPNLKNMDADLMAGAAGYDEGNAHSVIYMWGTTGIGYNVDAVAERLGEDYAGDSWDMVFDPATVSKLADCGVTILDAPSEIVPAALRYLGFDPNSEDLDEIEKAGELLKSIRPHVRYFHSSQYINDLANGDVCLSVGWSGDIFQARDRADEADNGVSVSYVIPKEGALQWFDMMAIPTDAPNVENAHKFINFIMDAQITADITNYVWYANGNAASMPLVDPEIVEDTGIFPSDEAKKNLWPAKVLTPKADRKTTRTWTSVKTGQ